MKIKQVDNTNFQGKLIIVNKLSNKPNRCIKSVKNDIESLIQKTDFNLYLRQDYGTNKICIKPNYPFPYKSNQKPILLTSNTEESFLINAKPSRYIDAVKSAIDKYENALNEKKQKEWEQKQKKQKIKDLKDIAETVICFPLFLLDDILHELNPKWGKKFEEKIIDKLL